MTITADEMAREIIAFNRGVRNGYQDAKLGLNLAIARTSPDTNYARGYAYGQAKAAGYVT